MDLFEAANGWWGGEGGPFRPKMLHISNNDETLHSYNLPKEDPKNYKTYDTPLELFHQQLAFFITPGNKDKAFIFETFFIIFGILLSL